MPQEHVLHLTYATLLVLVLLTATARADNTHEEAAVQLLESMNARSTALAATNTMADMMIAQNPMLAPYRSVLNEWAEQVFVWENFERKFVKIYTEAFSESEIRDMIRFYETPTGKKFVRLQPDLMHKGAQIGFELGQENAPLLDRMIRERAAELDDQ